MAVNGVNSGATTSTISDLSSVDEPHARPDSEQKSNRVIIVLFIAATLAVIPLWLVKYPPLQDYPNHLASAYVLAHLNDSSTGFSHHYRAEWGLKPYIVAYGLLVILQRICSIEVAGKLVLSLSVFVVPMAAWFFIREVNPAAEANSFWCLLLGYSPFFLAGFFAFQLSAALCFLVWALWMKYERTPRPAIWCAVFVSTTLLYFTHLMGFLVALTVIALYWIIASREIQKAGAWFAWFLPGGLLIFRQFVAGRSGQGGPADRLAANVQVLGVTHKLVRFASPFVGYSKSVSLIVLLLFGFWLIASLWRDRSLAWNHPWPRVAASMLLIFIVAPDVAGTLADARLVIFLFVVFLASFSVGRFRWSLVAIALLAVAFHIGDVAHEFMADQRDLLTVSAAIDTIPSGVRILPLGQRPASEELQRVPYLHFWGYGVIQKNWFSPYLFHGEGVLPLVISDPAYVPEWIDGEGRFAAPVQWQLVRRDYDYIWTENAPAVLSEIQAISDPVFHDGNFWVFKVRKTQ